MASDERLAAIAGRLAALQTRMLARDAELARLRRVEAAARALRVGAALHDGSYKEGPWWRHHCGEDWTPYCIACGEEAISQGAMGAFLRHAPDCAAMALDAALADDPGGPGA